MAVLDALIVLVVAGVVVYVLISWLIRATGTPARADLALGAGQWRSAHYDAQGDTVVVVQKLSPDGRRVLDEHTIATIPVGDPDYEDRFLAAMLAARQRQALFESEEG
ncbi:MAG: hypothetical protein QOF53_435 [Nocardioidaceae bacterium]|jgi:hypothetical protein|nr:hypothetical protein [Nocardioidaceae bacterium]